MRLGFLLLVATLILRGEFLRVEVQFDGVGCASCVASLESRLARVRGVAEVHVDPERSLVSMRLEKGNKVRLGPLVSRITQDGTKVVHTEVVARGAVEQDSTGAVFQPLGLPRKYRLETSGAPETLTAGQVFRVTGTVQFDAAASMPVLRATAIEEE